MKTYGAERAQERADLKVAYEAGASIRTLAAAHGHSYGYVHDALTETGTQLRGRGGPNNLNPAPIPPEKVYRRRISQADQTSS
ncbi:helix-turn-helix domain-containing protein [Mycobacteriaceae bacterium NPDC060252]